MDSPEDIFHRRHSDKEVICSVVAHKEMQIVNAVIGVVFECNEDALLTKVFISCC